LAHAEFKDIVEIDGGVEGYLWQGTGSVGGC